MEDHIQIGHKTEITNINCVYEITSFINKKYDKRKHLHEKENYFFNKYNNFKVFKFTFVLLVQIIQTTGITSTVQQVLMTQRHSS